MTVDERIEKLLNKVNQTILDLPKVDTNSENYWSQVDTLVETAKKFDSANEDDFYSLANYALHLSDVIDRMETGIDNYLMKQEEENNDEEHIDYEIAYNIGLKDGQIKSYKKLMDTMTNLVTDVIYALMPEGKA